MEVDERVEKMISTNPDTVLASYRNRFHLPADKELTPEMVRLHWEIERRGTREILTSGERERAATSERAYTELYERCPWLNQYAFSGDEPEVEFRGLLRLLGSARRIYEIGSGKGRLIRWLATKGYSCVGTEITAERGSKHVSDTGGLAWHGTDGVHLTQYEPAGSFDAVISIQVLEHIHPDDVPQHLRGVHDLLKNGGKYIFTTPHRYSGPADLSAVFGFDRPVCHHLREWSFGELAALLKDAGFVNIQAVYTAPLSVRRKAALLNRAVASRAYLRFLTAAEAIVDALPASARRVAIKALRLATLLRADVFLSAEKPGS